MSKYATSRNHANIHILFPQEIIFNEIIIGYNNEIK